MEHLQHFGLSQDPFANEPDLRFYLDTAPHRDAQRRVERGLRQSKGLNVLTGESGTGKSLLARRILEGLEEDLFEAGLLVMVQGVRGSGSLLRRFASQLEIETPAAEPSALMGQLYEALAVVREDSRHAVLIIDDAHLLGADALAEVNGLLNLEYEDRRLVSLLLVGLPELDEALSSDVSLGGRVDVRVRVRSLDLSDASGYLSHRIQLCGGAPGIVSDEAVGALFKLGRGRPRLLNTLADNALFEAYLAGRQTLSGVDVERAAGDLGVGVDPGSTYTAPAPPAAGGAVVGELTDPQAGDAMDTAGASAGLSAPDPAELGEMLDSAGDDEEELLTVLHDGGADDSALDLGAEIDAALEERRVEAEPTRPNPAFGASATRVALDDTDDEVDDLFVELLDD